MTRPPVELDPIARERRRLAAVSRHLRTMVRFRFGHLSNVDVRACYEGRRAVVLIRRRLGRLAAEVA